MANHRLIRQFRQCFTPPTFRAIWYVMMYYVLLILKWHGNISYDTWLWITLLVQVSCYTCTWESWANILCFRNTEIAIWDLHISNCQNLATYMGKEMYPICQYVLLYLTKITHWIKKGVGINLSSLYRWTLMIKAPWPRVHNNAVVLLKITFLYIRTYVNLETIYFNWSLLLKLIHTFIYVHSTIYNTWTKTAIMIT